MVSFVSIVPGARSLTQWRLPPIPKQAGYLILAKWLKYKKKR